MYSISALAQNSFKQLNKIKTSKIEKKFYGSWRRPGDFRSE
jgi:hypothetical protein